MDLNKLIQNLYIKKVYTVSFFIVLIISLILLIYINPILDLSYSGQLNLSEDHINFDSFFYKGDSVYARLNLFLKEEYEYCLVTADYAGFSEKKNYSNLDDVSSVDFPLPNMPRKEETTIVEFDIDCYNIINNSEVLN